MEYRILRYIKRYMLENGVTPTVREICNEFSIKSPSTADKYFKRLVELGEIIKVDGTRKYKVKGMRYIEDA